MRVFASLLVFAILSARAFCGDCAHGLSLFKSYVQRGTISFWGAEIPVAVYAAKTSGGGRAMVVDGGGTLIKAKFSADGRAEEIFVSDLMPGGEALGGSRRTRSGSPSGSSTPCARANCVRSPVDGLPKFAETENVRVEFLDYKKEKPFPVPQTLKISAGRAKIILRLSASEIGP